MFVESETLVLIYRHKLTVWKISWRWCAGWWFFQVYSRNLAPVGDKSQICKHIRCWSFQSWSHSFQSSGREQDFRSDAEGAVAETWDAGDHAALGSCFLMMSFRFKSDLGRWRRSQLAAGSINPGVPSGEAGGEPSFTIWTHLLHDLISGQLKTLDRSVWYTSFLDADWMDEDILGHYKKCWLL